MNDVLRTLRDARPAEYDPDAPVDEHVRRAELARAMATAPEPPVSPPVSPPMLPPVPVPVSVPARRRRFRPVWGAGLAGTVAAGALAAVVLVPSGEDGPEPPRAGGDTEWTLDAKTVLLTAAQKADGRPDTMRAYWHTVSIGSSTHTVGKAGARYSVTARSKYEAWTPSRPNGKVHGRDQYLGAKPTTPADEAAWRRAGSPDTFEVRVPIGPGSKITKPARWKLAPASPQSWASPLTGGDTVFWLGRNVTMKQLRALPSDPKRLKAELMRWYEGHDTESDRPMDAGDWLYEVTRGMVLAMPVRPEVRAAGFRMLAGLPAVKSIGQIKDPQGRTGAAIAVDKKTPGGVIRDQMIIDLTTGAALAGGTVMLRPAPGSDVPAGRTMSSEVALTAEWTDTPPR
ncbi:CU044_5270 family protein [Actinomadura sp. 9N215]|uniref:CU044_5270 family protein n=1 Tax=Actinomadura sp. 9N215 TaxID=3375150 RepID=UPI0037BD404E